MNTCSIEGCNKPAVSRTWCKTHWNTWRKHDDPEYPDQRRSKKKDVVCTAKGCDKAVAARTWCTTHWARWKKHGDPNHTTMPRWTAEDDAMLLAAKPTPAPDRRGTTSGKTEFQRVADTLGRTVASVYSRRWKLLNQHRGGEYE